MSALKRVICSLAKGRFRVDGCFYEFGVLCIGILIMRAVLFGVYIGAPDF